MAKTILISQEYLSDNGVINANTDYNLLLPVIVVCQDLKIRPLLGSDLYTQILNEAQAGVFTGQNKTLLDTYILPALLWFVAGESPLVLKFRLMNLGVVEKSNENNSQSSTDDVKLLEARYQGWAKNYADLVKKYIKANPTAFPAYFTSYGIGKTMPDKTPFTAGGLYIEDRPDYTLPRDYGDYRYRDPYRDSDYYYYNG